MQAVFLKNCVFRPGNADLRSNFTPQHGQNRLERPVSEPFFGPVADGHFSSEKKYGIFLFFWLTLHSMHHIICNVKYANRLNL